jgi:hypothetical protein
MARAHCDVKEQLEIIYFVITGEKNVSIFSEFLLKQSKNKFYLQRRLKREQNDPTKSISATHALKTLFSLPARYPSERESKITQKA